jgi:hypothetical protein
MPLKVSFCILTFKAMNYLRYLRSILFGFLVGCILFLLAVFYQIGVPTPTSKVISEVYAVKIQIANSIRTPKLIPISGSSALMGISCQTIHEQTGVPCVNGGTYAGLGVDYLLNKARSFTQVGDIVLLSLEYEHFTENFLPRKLLSDYVFAQDINYFWDSNLLTKIRLITGISLERLAQGMIAKNRLHKLKKIDDFPKKFINEYGDATTNIRTNLTSKQLKAIDKVKPVQLRDYFIKSNETRMSINKFWNWCKKNNIKVIATWPNTLWFEVYRGRSQQDYFQSIKDLYASMEIPIIGNPEDFMYDKSMFFDTIYHLNNRGVYYRTKQLIELLQPYLEELKEK